MNLAKMRRSPIIHGPQPPHRVFLLTPDEPSIPEHAGARHYIDRLREVLDAENLDMLHLRILNTPWPPLPGSPEEPIRIKICAEEEQ